jgi:hypothetical protein
MCEEHGKYVASIMDLGYEHTHTPKHTHMLVSNW